MGVVSNRLVAVIDCRVAAHGATAKMGWMTGLELATPGATVQVASPG
jgi:hypothetical protein